jgi:hypothetical protein
MLARALASEMLRHDPRKSTPAWHMPQATCHLLTSCGKLGVDRIATDAARQLMQA